MYSDYYPSSCETYFQYHSSPSSSVSPPPFDYPHPFVHTQPNHQYQQQLPHHIEFQQQPIQQYHVQGSAAVQSSVRPPKSVSQTRPVQISHPYARLFAKKDEVKRRKIWNHALEKSLFNPFELSTVGAPNRRTIYIASLEAHVDRLHSQLLELGFWPVAFSELDPFKGLNSKTAKSMVAGLQHDASVSKLKLLELERANADLTKFLSSLPEET
ncbi:hypothetical protein BYT27DRAFT_7189544 [Phlegmacium glaucopus]|nr:hypothetical protein BYT27DRAFT_7189544 [Phlegmacium glaucopus]